MYHYTHRKPTAKSEISLQSEDAVPLVSAQEFKDGMSRLAGPLNIITTDGPIGQAGFTATAVCSVTDNPPTLLVCINRSNSAAPAFSAHSSLCVNTVGRAHKELAVLFGGKTPMAERFAAGEWESAQTGAPVLRGANVAFDCRIIRRDDIGSHDVLFCEVLSIRKGGLVDALVYFARQFHEIG